MPCQGCALSDKKALLCFQNCENDENCKNFVRSRYPSRAPFSTVRLRVCVCSFCGFSVVGLWVCSQIHDPRSRPWSKNFKNFEKQLIPRCLRTATGPLLPLEAATLQQRKIAYRFAGAEGRSRTLTRRGGVASGGEARRDFCDTSNFS